MKEKPAHIQCVERHRDHGPEEADGNPAAGLIASNWYESPTGGAHRGCGGLITVRSTLTERLSSAGVRIEDVFRRARFSATALDGGSFRLTEDQFFAMWEALASLKLPPGFGLSLAVDVPPHQFDVASSMALHSRTLGDALQNLSRYRRLVGPEEMKVVLEGKEAQVRFSWDRKGKLPPEALVDAAHSWLLMLAERGAGVQASPLRLELARRASNERLLAEHFRCPIRFNSACDSIVFAEETLRLPFRSHNQELLDIMTPGLEAALLAKVSSASITQRVKGLLLTLLERGRPTVEGVAEVLRLSRRTLQRQLANEGSSYQMLLDEARHEIARRLLLSTDLEIADIALALGYEEMNSFTRAFRSWEGTTPIGCRRRAGVLQPSKSARGSVTTPISGG